MSKHGAGSDQRQRSRSWYDIQARILKQSITVAMSPKCSEAVELGHLIDVFQIPRLEANDGAADILLDWDDGVLFLQDKRRKGLKPLSVRFDRVRGLSKKHPFARAIGRGINSVVDATAGWGKDGFHLIHMGYNVTLIERNPFMAALLRNGLQRFCQFNSLEPAGLLVEADAIDYLTQHCAEWDCVYLDPMFPPKRKTSALAKRSLTLLRDLVGDDSDRHKLFESAMTAAKKRIVVKRPDHIAPLFPNPSETFPGKLVHYDVYLKQ